MIKKKNLACMGTSGPAIVDLATALCGFMKLTNSWETWFFSLQIDVLSI